MSEIYLTKIERKTIFTKSLIFVLIMFIISDLTVTGPFYFNFVPWLYILGLIGSIKKIDNILMSVIGTFTVFVSSLIAQGGFTMSCLISTVIALAVLILGIVTGKIIYEFILEHRLVKYIKPSRKAIYIVSIILMVIASTTAIAVDKGNVVSYLNSSSNLKSYIAKTYNTSEFKIKNVQYTLKVPGCYVYTVNIDGQDVYFIPVTKQTFKDANMAERLERLNTELSKNMEKKTSDILKKYSLEDTTIVTYNLEYTNVNINPDTVAMYIECTTNEENVDEVYENVSNFVKEIQTIKQTQKVVININNNSLQVFEQDIQKLDKEYIKGGFDVEEIIE